MKSYILLAVMFFSVLSVSGQKKWLDTGLKFTSDKSMVVNKTPVSPQLPTLRSTSLFSEGFEGLGIPSGWSNITTAGGNTWGVGLYNVVGAAHAGSSYAYIVYHPTVAHDAWLFTPDLPLESGKGYLLTFWIKMQGDGTVFEKLEVKIGNAAEVANMDVTPLYTTPDNENITGWKQIQIPYIASTTGDHYIGFHALSPANGYYIAIDDVIITEMPDIDIEVLSIDTPKNGNLTNTEQVTVTVRNNGTLDINNFSLKLELDGSEKATEAAVQTITSGATYSYDFSATLDLSALQNYTIKVTATLASDKVADNDAIEKQVVNAGPGIDLYGFRINTTGALQGLLSIPSSSPDLATQASTYTDGSNLIVAGEYLDGHLYMFSGERTMWGVLPKNFIKLSTNSWTEVSKVSISEYVTDMTYDYSFGMMYGVSNGNLYTINLETGEITLVTSLTTACIVIACDGVGTLYTMTTSGDLCTINKATGELTTIASTGLNPQTYFQSMTFDHVSGRLFLAYISDNEDGLLELNPSTGTYWNMGQIAGVRSQVTGLYSPFTITYTPEKGSNYVEIDATISATFDMNITGNSLAGITLSPDPGSVSASVSGQTITIGHVDLLYGTEYTVTIPGGSVNEIPFDISWSFTTKLNPAHYNKPTEVNVTDINSNEVKVSWRENGPALLWNVKYGPVGFDVNTEGKLLSDVSSNTDYLLNNLDHDTAYDLYIQSTDGSSQQSLWSDVCSFTTPRDCSLPVTAFPWSESFEGAWLPGCWTSYNIDGGGSEWAVNTNTSYIRTGSGSAGHNYDNGYQEGWLVTPKISIPSSGSYTLRFWSYNQYPEDYGKNSMWISTTGNNPSNDTFTEIWTPQSVTTSWVETIVDLSSYAGQEIYFGFKYEGDYAHGWYIDDVEILDFTTYVDAEISSITSPVSGNELTALESVTVNIKNNGGSDITGFELVLEVDGTQIASETYSGTINSLGEKSYTFTQKADLSLVQTYDIKVTVNVTGDMNTDNDSKEIVVENYGSNVVPPTPVPPVPDYVVIRIPEIEGIVTNPAAGKYEHPYGEHWSLEITPLAGYSLEEVIVRINGKIITPTSLRATAESLSYHMSEVRDHLVIEIEGVKSGPSGTDKVDGTTRIYTLGTTLYAETTKAGELAIFTVAGQLVFKRPVDAGTTTVSLQRGVYIVRLEKESWKIVCY